jgi:hypothetical protein
MGVFPHTLLCRRADVSWRELSDGAVLVNMRSGECFELNRVGLRVWQALDGSRDISQLCDDLCATYSIDRETSRADVEMLVTSLLTAELVEECVKR